MTTSEVCVTVRYIKYRILLVNNSHGYYKFQVQELTEIFISKLCIRYKVIVSTLYYVVAISEPQLLTDKIWYSNCTVNPSNLENQEIYFYRHLIILIRARCHYQPTQNQGQIRIFYIVDETSFTRTEVTEHDPDGPT